MAADSGHYCVLVLLDVSSACDRANHKMSLHRLQDEISISGTVFPVVFFLSVLEIFSMFVNNIMPATSPLLHGVPQGSVTGPVFFLLYISSLGKIISSFKSVSYHLYAMILNCSALSMLQSSSG